MRALLLLPLILLACARPHLAARPDAPAPPPGATTTTFEGVRGTTLVARSWRPPDGVEPRGVLVIMHGLRDHGDRYAEVAARLVERGYAVHAFDLRGHGRSAGRRVTITSFDDYVADLDRFVGEVRAREPGRPLFLFGHSMGGAIVTLWTITRGRDVAGVILSAPALRIDAPPLQAAAIRTLSALTPNLGLLAPDNRHFSSDREVEAAMGKDPLIHQPAGPVHTAAGLVGAIERIWAGMDRLTPPLLLLHGTGDHLTAPAGSRDVHRRAASTDKTLRLYPGLAHDLVHEPGHDAIVADMASWLDAHTGGPAVAFAAPDPDARLRGDRRRPSIAVALELGGRRSDAAEPVHTAGAATRARFLLGRWPGWSTGLDAEIAGGDALGYRAALHPLGLGIAGAAGHAVSLSVGAGVSRPPAPGASAALELPVALDAELQLGPVRLLGWGRLAWLPASDSRDPELHAGAAVRLGRHHHYWPGAGAGTGPYLGATLDRALDVTTLGVVLGLHLWGGP